MPNYYMPSYPLLGIEEARAGMEGAAIDRVEFVTVDDDDPEQDYFCLTLSTGLSVYGSAPSVYGPHPEHAFYSPHVVTRKRDGQQMSDADALDVLAEYLHETPDWNGGDFCELAARVVAETGREV